LGGTTTRGSRRGQEKKKKIGLGKKHCKGRRSPLKAIGGAGTKKEPRASEKKKVARQNAPRGTEELSIWTKRKGGLSFRGKGPTRGKKKVYRKGRLARIQLVLPRDVRANGIGS